MDLTVGYTIHVAKNYMSEVKIAPSWKKELKTEFSREYWETLTATLHDKYASETIYPPPKNIFRAFELCPFDSVKVVIVGQDPYHGVKQANGLSFSVNDGTRLPPSLKNIYQEIRNDLGVTPFPTGDLTRWAKQGVLMLNSVLTVGAGKPASHSGLGWELFTDAVIQSLNARRTHIVYLLWGKYAQKKGEVIDSENNLILTSAHPSPYSVTGFYGNHHFSKCNDYLSEYGLTPIDWR